MPHLKPSPMDLSQQLFNLKKDYITLEGDTMSERRRMLINLVASFQETRFEKYDHDAALGCCLYGLLTIEQEFRLSSTEKSSLYTLLKKCMNITTTRALTDYEAAVYLFHFYAHLQKYPRKLDGTRTHQEDDSMIMLNKVTIFLKNYFQHILKNPPSYESLQKNFIKISKEYKPKKTYFGFGKVDVTRDQDIKRIIIIDEVLNQMTVSDEKDQKIKERAYKVRLGTLLYIMTKIEDSYAYSLRSPENSLMYQLCQRVTCLKNTSFVSEQFKKEYYDAFIDFTSTIQFNLRWRNAGLETAEYIDKEWKRISSKSYLQRYSFYLMDYAARYGVQIMVGTIAATMLSQFRLTGIIIATTAEWIAPEYALLLQSLAPILGEQLNACAVSIISGAVSRILIEPVGKPMIVITFSSMKSLYDFVNNMKQDKKNAVPKKYIVDPEFHHILAEIPENILTKEDHEKVRNIIGYEMPEKLYKEDVIKKTQLSLT